MTIRNEINKHLLRIFMSLKYNMSQKTSKNEKLELFFILSRIFKKNFKIKKLYAYKKIGDNQKNIYDAKYFRKLNFFAKSIDRMIQMRRMQTLFAVKNFTDLKHVLVTLNTIDLNMDNDNDDMGNFNRMDQENVNPNFKKQQSYESERSNYQNSCNSSSNDDKISQINDWM